MEREILSFPTDSLVNQLVVEGTMNYWHQCFYTGNLRNSEVLINVCHDFIYFLPFSLYYISFGPNSYAADSGYECSKPKLYLSSLVSNPYNKNTQVENSITNIITLV